MSIKPPTKKCSACRTNGEPCGNWPIRGGTVCVAHGGRAPQVRKAAQDRIREAAEPAAAYLVAWLSDETLDMSLRVRVAQDLLDRAGVSKNASLTVGVTPKFEALLSGERGGSAVLVDVDIEDAEVLDEDDTAQRDLAAYRREQGRLAAPPRADVPSDLDLPMRVGGSALRRKRQRRAR